MGNRFSQVKQLLAQLLKPTPQISEERAANQHPPPRPPITVPGFTLLTQRSSNGPGEVWWASAERAAQLVTLYILPTDSPLDPENRSRFLRGAGICARLHHTSIVRFLDQGATSNALWFATELIQDKSLRQFVEEYGPLTLDDATAVMNQALDIVAYLHQEGVVHRSLRPDSFLVKKRSGVFTVQLADLGSAKCFQSAELQLVTREGERGYPVHAFTAPEALKNFKIFDRRSDIYALGAILYFALTGCDPYDLPDGKDLKLAILHQDPPPLHMIKPDLPQAVVTIVERAMARDVDARYSTVQEMCDAWAQVPPPPPPGVSSDAIPLTLRLVPQKNSVQIIWEADVIGQRTSTFRYPYDRATLPLVIKALDAVQWPTHPLTGPRFDQSEQEQLTRLGFWTGSRVVPDVHRRIGQALYNALIADRRGEVALRTMRDYATAQGQPLSYMLRFPPEAINLATLPWEVLWDERGPLLLSRGELAACVRYLGLDQALPPPVAPGSTLHILAIAPNAGIPAPIRAEERAVRIAAWSELEKAGIVELDEMNPATLRGLVERIQHGPPVDILHFYGHGRYKDGQGSLLFDADNGGEIWVGADRLAALLGKTRLIMLHACQSAMIDDAGLFTGVAPALSAAGVPAVVAMQLTIRIDAATRFAEVVYHSLARGDSVQHAVSQARQALFAEESDGASWYVPTLTLCTRNTGPFRLVDRKSR